MYDSAGADRLRSQVLTVDFATALDAQDEELSHTKFARTPGTTETAPPLVSHLILALRSHVHPDFLFLGSFGSGGKKVGVMGSVTDYMIRLTTCSTFIIKNWRPVPTMADVVVFVVALDGGEPAFQCLARLLDITKAGDIVKGLMLSVGPETDDDRAIRTRATDIYASSSSSSSHQLASFSVEHRQMREGEGAVGAQLCDACDELEADFLCMGTKMIAPGAEDRVHLPALGSVALYCSQHCRCHAIIFK